MTRLCSAADAVLVTVPLGILKRNHIKFYPPLNERKMGAINRLGFGVLNKVGLLVIVTNILLINIISGMLIALLMKNQCLGFDPVVPVEQRLGVQN